MYSGACFVIWKKEFLPNFDRKIKKSFRVYLTQADATESGTTSAYLDTMKIINTMKSEYTHLFYSETDVSVFAG